MGRMIGFAVLVAALVLGACSGDTDSGGTTTSTAGSVTPPTTQPATPITTSTAGSITPPTTQPPAPTTSLASAESPTTILFVGDSFTSWRGGLRNQLLELAASATQPPNIETAESAFGGATLEKHWKDSRTPEIIANGDYDIVVLQGQIPDSDVGTFQENARNLVEAAREAGAEPVLLMAWDFEGGRGSSTTMDEIAQAHTDIAAELDVDVAPVGLAFERVSEERPELDMLGLDKVHQSAQGSYLAVNVVYVTIFGAEHSDTLTHLLEGITITEEEATFLQRVARETVSDYTANQTS